MNRFKNWIMTLGPGIITAALVFGPSKMTIATKLGASYGFALLWLIVVAIFFMVIFTAMAARIGCARDESLLNLIGQKWGKIPALLVGIGIFIVTACFQAGNSIGIGIALGESTHTPTMPWTIAFTIIGIGLLFFQSFYKVLEKVMIALVTLMLTAFLTTMVILRPDPVKIIGGFSPVIPEGSMKLVVAFMASTFSIVAAFYQAYLIQQRRKLNKLGSGTGSGSFTGIFILGIMAAIIVICAASVLQPRGIVVKSASDMAKSLEPLFGRHAAIFFLMGLFGGSFSALLGNATVGGTLFADALGYGRDLSSKKVKMLIAVVMIIGCSVAVTFGTLPLELIVFTQSVTIFLVPFIGLAMYTIANDVVIMGKLVNNTWQKVFGGVGLAIVVGLAVTNIFELFK
jgi:manganese transport protein